MMQRITLNPGMAANTQPIKTPRFIQMISSRVKSSPEAGPIKSNKPIFCLLRN